MSSAPTFSGFPKEGLQFLQDLAANNNREWFKAHENDYADFLLAPGQAFVIALGERLKSISPRIQYDPQTHGSGSIMRIYRDMRFSKDKSPYHTYLRIIFWEGQKKKTDNPAFYFSIDEGAAVVFAGLHMFPKNTLDAYRAAVLHPERGAQLESALAAVRQAGCYEIGGATNKHVPPGYPAEHPRAGLLLNTGLWAMSPKIETPQLMSPELVDVCYQHCRGMAPLQQWLAHLT